MNDDIPKPALVYLVVMLSCLLGGFLSLGLNYLFPCSFFADVGKWGVCMGAALAFVGGLFR